MSTRRHRTFLPAGAPSPPNADERISADPVPVTSGRPDVTTSTPPPREKIAFTWRLTPDEHDRLDDMVRDVRRQAGLRRLDRATLLQALVDLTHDNPAVYGALIGRLQDV